VLAARGHLGECCRPRRARAIRSREQLAQQPVEGGALARAQRGQDLLLVRDVHGQRLVKPLPAERGQPNARSAPVAGVGCTLDQTRFGEAVEPLRHPARGEHGRLHQLRRVELEGRSVAPERREQIEPAGLKPGARQPLPQPRVRKLRGAKQTAEELERADIDVRALAPPRGGYAVEMVHAPS